MIAIKTRAMLQNTLNALFQLLSHPWNFGEMGMEIITGDKIRASTYIYLESPQCVRLHGNLPGTRYIDKYTDDVKNSLRYKSLYLNFVRNSHPAPVRGTAKRGYRSSYLFSRPFSKKESPHSFFIALLKFSSIRVRT